MNGLIRNRNIMKITDSEDDYTVTADQRAALMELESLTWNYPTPQQQQQARPARPSSLPQACHDDEDDDDDDTDDEDDDDSYYVDMAPYDMTERLKEVNRAFIEDPTPAECDRTITVRFREVIADFQSPREYYPSDSDDGYGDSSDLLYDAEEEDGLTSLTPEVKDVLGGNVNVVDLTNDENQDDGSGDYVSVRDTPTITAQDDSGGGYKSLSVSNDDTISCHDDDDHDDHDGNVLSKTEVPKLQLGDDQDASQVSDGEDQTGRSLQTSSDKALFEGDDSGLADLEAFMKETDASEILETLLDDSSHVDDDEDDCKRGTMSLVEVSERVHVERDLSSLGDEVNRCLKLSECRLREETNSDNFFARRESKEMSEPTNVQLPARSDADFASLDYSDDFEDFQDETDCTEVEKYDEEEESSPVPSNSPRESPVHTKSEPDTPPEVKCETHGDARKQGSKNAGNSDAGAPQTRGHRSRRDHRSRTASGSEAEMSNRRPEIKSPTEDGKCSSPTKAKPKRVASGPPLIKPALLPSERLNNIKTTESGRLRSRNSSASKSRPRSTVSSSSSSSSSSPLSSASSSSSSSSSLSSHSSPHTRGRGRTSISGPVRATTHKSPVGHRVEGVRGVSSSPVRPPSSTSSHHGLTLMPSNPTPPGRVDPAPPARVRKAASASDLHKVSDEPEYRRRQNEEVFRAWLRQKNKQAAITRRQQHPPSAGKTSAEVAERRKRAEEAFQAWLARKREQLKLEKKLRGERRRLEDQSRYARTKAECEVAYKEWCRRKRDEVRTTSRGTGGVPRSQSLERPWVQEKTRKLYTAYLNGH
ncbi:uncharacterized protein [Panulirus ornatus]|uniref:uncharacterized protein isoform X2 n=1 Tax=Panulirus ornatus TaxID=150431 RepID=UPI003A87A455